MRRLYALRGACQCRNEAADMGEQVAALFDELLARNKLAEADIVSVVFSVTRDLDAANPAAVLRRSGRAGDLALFAVQEAFVHGGLARVVRVLLHCYMEDGTAAKHVYRNGAETLRPDRGA